MSTDTSTPDDTAEEDVFDRLYEQYGETYEDLAESDSPIAPLAQLIIDEAGGDADG